MKKQKKASPKEQKPSGLLALASIPAWAATLVIFLASFLVYANSLHGQFVFDDTVIVQENESIRGLDGDHLAQIFGQHYWRQVESRGGLYRPVVMLSYALNYAEGEGNPAGYHFVNILIHALNGVLVFFVLEGLFSRRLLSFVTALLFALHPIRTEGVASIVGRAETLSALFALLAWLLYIRACRNERGWSHWAGGFCLMLAVLSKESAFACIALLPLTDILAGPIRWMRPIAFLKERGWDLCKRYLPYVLALGIVLALRYRVLGGFTPLYINPRSNPIAGVDGWARFLTATSVSCRYLWLLVFPGGLSADYSYNQIPVLTSILDWRAAVSAATLLLAIAGTILSVRRFPVLFFSGYVFFSLFLLTSNWIRPIGTIMAERLMYFPSLGFNCAVAFLLVEGFRSPRWRTTAVSAGSIVLAAYGMRTIARNPDWKDHYSLFGSAVRTSPGSSLVQSNFAAVLLNERRDFAGAMDHARKAVGIYPEDPAAWFTLGRACRRLSDRECAGKAFSEVIRLAPNTAGGAAALRERAEMQEFAGDLGSAGTDYGLLSEWLPSDPSVWLARARVFSRQGDRSRAGEALEKARQVAPADPHVVRALRDYGLMR